MKAGTPRPKFKVAADGHMRGETLTHMRGVAGITLEEVDDVIQSIGKKDSTTSLAQAAAKRARKARIHNSRG